MLATFLKRRPSIGGEPQATEEPRVLVVDDEALIRWALVETLADAHEAVEAKDARTALQALLTAPEPFDVVLLDRRLPDLSGLTVLSTLRCWSPRTQVILTPPGKCPHPWEHFHAHRDESAR